MGHETLKRGRQDGGNQVKKKHRDHFGMQESQTTKRGVKEQIIRENKNAGKQDQALQLHARTCPREFVGKAKK